MDIQTKTDIIHQKIYDFLLYIYPLLTKYPKYEKFSLQTATRNAILEMLQEVIKWDKTATKSHLYTVDTALQESKDNAHKAYYQEVRERENHKRAVTKEYTELDGTHRTRRQL